MLHRNCSVFNSQIIAPFGTDKSRPGENEIVILGNTGSDALMNVPNEYRMLVTTNVIWIPSFVETLDTSRKYSTVMSVKWA